MVEKLEGLCWVLPVWIIFIMCVTLPICVVSTAVCCLSFIGITISKNTLHNWLKKGKKYLDELVRVLKSVTLEKDSIVNCDETWCKVRKYDHYKKCYIWVLVNKAQKIAIFFYENGSRGREVLYRLLGWRGIEEYHVRRLQCLCIYQWWVEIGPV